LAGAKKAAQTAAQKGECRMGTRPGTAALAGSVALAALALPAAARAQDSLNAPPAERFLVSPGGVDMRSGRYVYSQTDLSIGGEGGLSLTRTLAQPVAGHTNPFANFSHNWDVLISEKRIDIAHNRFTHLIGNPDYQMEVAFGGLSQTFRGYGTYSSFEQTSRAGYGTLSFTGDRDGGTAVFTFTGGDGSQAVFRPIGSADCSTTLRCAYVSQITEPDGTRLDFAYDSAGGANAARLRSVVSSRGYALLIEYAGVQVVKACLLNLALAPKPADNVCPSGAQAVATYSYTSVSGAPRLASAVDPSGATWGFTYPSANAIGFVRPGETAPWLVNTTGTLTDDEGLVTEYVGAQNFADGSAYGYNFDFTPFVPLHASQIAGGYYVDQLGNRTTLRYDFPTVPNPGGGHGNVPGHDEDPQPQVYQVTPGPVEITDPLGRTTHVDYCDPVAMAQLQGLQRCVVLQMPVSSTTPGGIRTEFVSDMVARNVLQRRQIAQPGSGLPDIVTSATYNCSPATLRFCNKPVTTTDARGNVTEYTYAPEHGGLLTETGPAPSPGAPRPQVRHLYAQRYAWIANGGGGYVQAASPVWVETATSQCRSSAATGNPASPCSAAGDEVLTQYDYGPDSGPNNLLRRGQTVTATDNGVTATLRTCYGYDSLGRRISETTPNANPASCP
jgi:YD repeat-containing protein